MNTKLAVAFLLAVSLFISVPLFAHHGSAAYDMTKTIMLKATVTGWLWANPHCVLQFDVKDDKGNVEHWGSEVSNPADMVRRGWNSQSFKAGDEVTLTVNQAKSGAHVARIEQAILANGQTLSYSLRPQ
jgi:hypothetical protein